jgi:hypothetical protein
MSAVDACNKNAFAFAVENTAVPLSSVAVGTPSFIFKAAVLAPDNQNRAAPARICMLPNFSVLR